MKDFMCLLITLILTAFSVGIAYLQVTYGKNWGSLFLPLIVMYFFWGAIIAKKYSN